LGKHPLHSHAGALLEALWRGTGHIHELVQVLLCWRPLVEPRIIPATLPSLVATHHCSLLRLARKGGKSRGSRRAHAAAKPRETAQARKPAKACEGSTVEGMLPCESQ